MRQLGPPRRTQYKIGSSREPPNQNHHFNDVMLLQVLRALDSGFALASNEYQEKAAWANLQWPAVRNNKWFFGGCRGQRVHHIN